jgi:hypothetical protein
MIRERLMSDDRLKITLSLQVEGLIQVNKLSRH